MSTRDKIWKAIHARVGGTSASQREGYEDNYDGFTHQTYKGLADQVEEELENEGLEPTQENIEELVYELW